MRAEDDEKTLTTRSVSFQGKLLFVNVDTSSGELRVEALEKNGKVIAPYSRAKCIAVRADRTLQAVHWKGAQDLSTLCGRPIRFRFYLRRGDLYAFWVSPSKTGASYGYVAAGGPGFLAPTDTVGLAAA